MGDSTVIRSATRADVPVILTLIHGLADYENEPDAVVATENCWLSSCSDRSPAPRW